MTFEEYLGVLESCGWFLAYSDATKSRLAADLKRNWEKDPAYAVYSLGVASWDPEDADGADAAIEIVRNLVRVSEGHFQPENLTRENFKEEVGGRKWWTCRLSFVHAGRTTTVNLALDDRQSFEDGVVRACNDSLREAGSPYRFCDVPSGDQCYYHAFVTPEAYAQVEGRGWLKVQEVRTGVWGAVVQ